MWTGLTNDMLFPWQPTHPHAAGDSQGVSVGGSEEPASSVGLRSSQGGWVGHWYSHTHSCVHCRLHHALHSGGTELGKLYLHYHCLWVEV